jgi:hypothetical protein
VRGAAFLAAIALALGAAGAAGEMAGERSQERAFRREVARELDRLHRANDRLRLAVARGVPEALRVLARIGSCESGLDPRAVSPGGRYRGAWQWDGPTWRSVGGRGDPTHATIEEQWARALLLYIARGTQPWPTCGRGL